MQCACWSESQSLQDGSSRARRDKSSFMALSYQYVSDVIWKDHLGGKTKAQFGSPQLCYPHSVIIKLRGWPFSLQERKSTLAKVGVTTRP